MPHLHTYDAQGKQLCCTPEKQVDTKSGEGKLIGEDDCCSTHDHQSAEHTGTHGHNQVHTPGTSSIIKMFLPAIFSLVLLLAGITMDYGLPQSWFVDWVRVGWYVIAYIPVGVPVLRQAVKSIEKGAIFSEFFLMSIATIGAFAIGVYPEGVAVMLFYTVGEVFQSMAVSRAKANIKSLLDQRPDEVTVIRNNVPQPVNAETVHIDEIIQLKPGEKVGLDGELISETASFNTSALTGESKPDTKYKGETVLAGMINLHAVTRIKVTTAYTDSKLSKILEMVQNASSRKAPTELFIRKFAKIYTPIVVFLAIGICLMPYFFVTDYQFHEWLYRALVFLVISCPCALVISIPLGYFGGIGAASRNGILIKGSNYLDALANVQHVVMDKTGTLTEGVFKVQEVVFDPAFVQDEILQMINVLESHSTHPIASAIREFAGTPNMAIGLVNTLEIPGLGLKTTIEGKDLLVGNFKLMDRFGIPYDTDPDSVIFTTIAVAYDNVYVGYLTIADQIKENAKKTIQLLHGMNVKTTMLSGDKGTIVEYVAEQLGIHRAFGDLLPEEKVIKVSEIDASGESVAFVGDGVNDAPVVALSDIGIAMGGLGSDATIETADVVIQDDQPGKIPIAIRIGKKTKQIVWQNIGLAFGVKAIVLILGAFGMAAIWGAVFADVGVALLAIFNAIRIQRIRF